LVFVEGNMGQSNPSSAGRCPQGVDGVEKGLALIGEQ